MTVMARALHRGIFKLLRGVELIGTLGRGVATGVSLGILDRNDVHMIDHQYYEESHSYVSDDYNRDGLFEWERRAVLEYFPLVGILVVLGAGGGREVIALARMGFEVVGYECHAKLLKGGIRLIGREEGPAELRAMERDLCPQLPEGVVGVIIGWGVYMLIQGRERRIRLLRDLRSYVAPESPILLSFFARQAEQWRFRVAQRVAGPFRTLLGREMVEEGDYLAPNWVHYFTEEEVRFELEEAGWELVKYRKAPYGNAIARAV